MIAERTKTAREMMEDRNRHRVVELVGGPLDGKRFVEDGSNKFSHNQTFTYTIEGCRYSPDRVEAGVLYMRYVGGAAGTKSGK